MKFEALRRSLVRWIEPRATSVSPKNRPDSVVVTMTPFGYSGRMEYVGPPWMAPAPSLGIKPPTDRESEGWTWEAWQREFNTLAIRGWSPCRFAHRKHGDQAAFVFGVTRGAFGIWQRPFDVSHVDESGAWKQDTDTLSLVTHLRTGIGLGVFGVRETAAQACDLAERVAPEFEQITFANEAGSPWALAIVRMIGAWRSMGITPAVNAHAHEPGTGDGPYAINGIDPASAAADKPEKLS